MMAETFASSGMTGAGWQKLHPDTFYNRSTTGQIVSLLAKAVLPGDEAG
ncbi:MAG: hypothetical protein GY822_17215 [Deltaproteobacteria bacterium]|nr:hypothetical protein [Deltaproteobacteria bacterium]